MWQAVRNKAVEQYIQSFIVFRRMHVGLILYLATRNKLFCSKRGNKEHRWFFDCGWVRKSLDLSQNRPVKGTGIAAAKVGKSLKIHLVHFSASVSFIIRYTFRTVFPSLVMEADNKTSGHIPVSSGCTSFLTKTEDKLSTSSCREMSGYFGLS